MKITYNENPLKTTIELNELEREELWFKIKLEEMKSRLLWTHIYLKEGSHFSLEKARQMVEPNDYYSDDEVSAIDKRTHELLAYYVEELMSSHAGDCTCVACSCDKCRAEDLIGINTIKGLDKHSASFIDSAFCYGHTIDEAISHLAHYQPVKGEYWDKFSQEQFDSHIPRWTLEAKMAHDWLLNYKNTYLIGLD